MKCVCAPLHQDAVALAGWSVGVLSLLNLLNKELEGLRHIHIITGTGFGPGAAQLLSELLALLGGDLSLFRSKVALIADDTDGDLLRALRRERQFSKYSLVEEWQRSIGGCLNSRCC